MGNHGSRRDHIKYEKQGGKAAHTLSRVEELRGPPVDSYDKLIAWLAEMAESDNLELDTSVFVSHLNQVCRGRASFLDVSTDGARGNSVGCRGRDNGISSTADKRAPNTRQNSTSCDSHVSSSDVTQRNKSSTRSDDYFDPSSAWRSGFSTRQNTFSDELGEEDDCNLLNASIESLYSSTDRDSELGSILAYDVNCQRNDKMCSFQSNSQLITDPLSAGCHCVHGAKLATPCSASTGNLELTDPLNVIPIRRIPNHYANKSASHLNLSKPETIIPRQSIPTSTSPQIRDTACSFGPQTENLTVRKKLGPKSLSVTSGRNKRAKFERQFSLHSEPRHATSGGILNPVFPIHPTVMESPVKPKNKTAATFLNDTLLDQNIADILFSLEALWPNK